jgi:outer membrane protein TolC
VLSYEQPLLNGAGQAYNTSLIVLAEIDTAIAWNRTARDLQAHLMDVTTAYWDLYLQRAALLQMDRSRQRAEEIMTELQRRRDVDSLQSQIARARSAVATRRAQLIRTEASIRNAEAKLRALINAPDLCAGENLELIPLECPTTQCLPVAVRPALVTALENRPEIDSAVKDLDAAAVRLNMSRNELLPMLSLVLESHVSGLEGHSQVGEAWQDQFRKGEPSYAAGLKFEVPLYNRAAQARHQRRQLELRQLTHKFNATVETLLAEVEVAVRDVNASYREMHGKFSAMTASLTDVEYITERWKLLPGDDRAASFLLEDLLDAQDRLANEEFGFSQAQINYAVALAELKRATGTLLSCRQISPQLIDECGLPRMLLGTGTARGPSEASVPAAAPTSPPADTPPLIAPAPASSTSAAMLPGRSAPVGAWLKSH